MAGVRKRLGSLLGPTGQAAGISGATAETVAPGASPQVVTSGPSTAKAFHFKIPQGPQGLPGTGAVPADAAVAGYIGTAGASATKAAVQAAIRERAVVIDVRDHGAKGDGIADDTAAVQAAATAARDAKARLFVPQGDYRLTAHVNVWTDLDCVGRFVVSSTTPGGILIRRAATPVTLTASSITGLAADSQKVGITQTGTLLLRSTETAIKRTDGSSYTKTDVAEVTKTDGTLSLPLIHSYTDVATVTATLFPTEPPLVVNGLRVAVTNGGVEPAEVTYLGVQRSNVTLRNPTVNGVPAANLNSGITIKEATNVTLERPVVTDFRGPLGYGIAAYATAHTRYIDGTATGCRHATSGRDNKDIRVEGGTYEGGIDDHWVYGLHLRNVTSVIAAAPLHPLATHVLAAGRDVTAEGCTFVGGSRIVGIRADTPELGGDLIVTGGSWAVGGSSGMRAVGYASAVPSFDFGRPLASPSLCKVEGLRMRNAPAAVAIVRIDDMQSPHSYWRRIEISDVTWSGMAADVIALWADRRPALHVADTVGTSVLMRRLDYVNNFAGFRILNTGDTADSLQWSVRIEDCVGLRLEHAENAVADLLVVRGTLRAWAQSSATATAPAGRFRLEGVLLDAVAFNSRFLTDFQGCIWRGTSTHAVLSANDRVKSYRGNLHEVGASGHPTHADGYRNTTFYKAT